MGNPVTRNPDVVPSADSNRNENRRGAILRFAGLMASEYSMCEALKSLVREGFL